jgi:hypothetical protein
LFAPIVGNVERIGTPAVAEKRIPRIADAT